VQRNNVHAASLWGPVVTDHKSRWFMRCPRGTDQTRELNGIGQKLMWVNNVPVDDDDAVVVYNSMYATNRTQENGNRKPTAQLGRFCGTTSSLEPRLHKFGG
jgi:hypothetical protein